MSKIKIDHHKFARFVRIFDRVTGTIEPSTRRVYFYANSGNLMAYGTDGCLSVDLTLGDIASFDGFYAVLLDDLKLLLREKSEDVMMEFGSTFQISKGTEIISILHPFVQNPRKKDEVETDQIVDTMQLKRTLDIGSIISREGQMIFVGSQDGRFFSACEDYGHTGLAFMNFHGANFAIEIPYESVRHLVKTLDSIREDKIWFGYSKTIEMKFSDGTLNICSNSLEDTGRIEEIMNFDGVDFEIPVKALKEGATLSSRFQRRNGGRGYLDLSETMKFVVLSQVSAYEYTYPIQWGEAVRIPIAPRKFQQFFSRINEKYVKVGLTDRYLIFKGMQSILIVRIGQ